MALKKKGKELTYTIIAIVAGILSYLGFISDWAMEGTTFIKFTDFFKNYVMGTKTETFNPILFKVSFAFLVVGLLSLAILIVTLILQIFIEHKTLDKMIKVLKHISYIGLGLFLVAFVTGGFTCYPKENIGGFSMPSVMVVPYIGVVWTVLCDGFVNKYLKKVLRIRKETVEFEQKVNEKVALQTNNASNNAETEDNKTDIKTE